ncbi:hypothetical protein AB0J71_18590 [Nonomuraea sp. NPDC049637]|uniref:hypothetical protein n=1 Tax=Nonomuraea sp. NPDC049637 TaxID=3154356 RepID=UPI00342F54A6
MTCGQGRLCSFAPAAHAVPDGCTASTVLHVNPSVGYVYNVGPWVSPGQVSSATIPPGTIISIRVNKR